MFISNISLCLISNYHSYPICKSLNNSIKTIIEQEEMSEYWKVKFISNIPYYQINYYVRFDQTWKENYIRLVNLLDNINTHGINGGPDYHDGFPYNLPNINQNKLTPHKNISDVQIISTSGNLLSNTKYDCCTYCKHNISHNTRYKIIKDNKGKFTEYFSDKSGYQNLCNYMFCELKFKFDYFIKCKNCKSGNIYILITCVYDSWGFSFYIDNICIKNNMINSYYLWGYYYTYTDREWDFLGSDIEHDTDINKHYNKMLSFNIKKSWFHSQYYYQRKKYIYNPLVSCGHNCDMMWCPKYDADGKPHEIYWSDKETNNEETEEDDEETDDEDDEETDEETDDDSDKGTDDDSDKGTDDYDNIFEINNSSNKDDIYEYNITSYDIIYNGCI